MKYYHLISCILLTACSNLPPAIEDAPLYDVSYMQASQNINNYKNSPVRWGGVIVNVENEQNSSLVQILSYPLNGFGRPMLDETNQGRFVIQSPQFLDPAIYAPNTSITIAGTLTGDIERTIGKKSLRLPLVSATTLYLWPPQVDNYYSRGSIGFDYGSYGFGAYPYYWRPYYRPLMPYPWWGW